MEFLKKGPSPSSGSCRFHRAILGPDSSLMRIKQKKTQIKEKNAQTWSWVQK
jgi:hypothetical protein